MRRRSGIIDRAVGVHLAADDRVGFFHALDGDEEEDLLGRQVEVGVDEDDEFAPRPLRARRSASPLPACGSASGTTSPGKCSASRAISAPELSELPSLTRMSSNGPSMRSTPSGLLHVGGDVRGLVIERHDDRKLGGGRRHGCERA